MPPIRRKWGTTTSSRRTPVLPLTYSFRSMPCQPAKAAVGACQFPRCSAKAVPPATLSAPTRTATRSPYRCQPWSGRGRATIFGTRRRHSPASAGMPVHGSGWARRSRRKAPRSRGRDRSTGFAGEGLSFQGPFRGAPGTGTDAWERRSSCSHATPPPDRRLIEPATTPTPTSEAITAAANRYSLALAMIIPPDSRTEDRPWRSPAVGKGATGKMEMSEPTTAGKRSMGTCPAGPVSCDHSFLSAGFAFTRITVAGPESGSIRKRRLAAVSRSSGGIE